MKNMRKEIGNFVSKKAGEYVEQHGYEVAVEKLSALSIKSVKAKEILDVILSEHAPKVEKKEAVRRDTFVDNRTTVDVTRMTTRPMKPSPKEHYSNMVERTGIGFDAEADDEWNPVCPVEWKNGRAFINNMPVFVPQRYVGFMRDNVFRYPGSIKFNMHLVDEKRGKIIALPDIDDFHRRKAKELREKNEKEGIGKEFEGAVYAKGRYLEIRSSAFSENIVIPGRFLPMLAVKGARGNYLGAWKFRILANKGDKVVAEPVEMVEKPFESRQMTVNRKPQQPRKQETYSNASFSYSISHGYGKEERIQDEKLEQLYNKGSVKL
jgi:hypothetical protein